MSIYFDHAATTQTCSEAIEAMVEAAGQTYGNPSSLHGKGMAAEDRIVDARKFFAKTLGVTEKEIFFTSGGTESNNLAIQGVARAYRRTGMHVITTEIEHPSVGSVFASLEEEGFRVTRLGVDDKGHIKPDELREAIDKETILVSIMQVNNEIGTVQDMNLIGKLVKEANPGALLHVDGVQGFMKLPLNLKNSRIDLYSVSSHKIHGPKGVGALYLRHNVKIKPLFYGGSQQNGIRPGTENVPGICGFHKAAVRACERWENGYVKAIELKKALVDKLNDKLPEWMVNSPVSTGVFEDETASPYIVSIRSASIKGEVILHALEDYGFYVSTGSACSSKKLNISHVLKAIGLKDIESDRSIRISFCADNTIDEIDEFVNALCQIDAMFGRFVKR